jgi:hypothetical protein
MHQTDISISDTLRRYQEDITRFGELFEELNNHLLFQHTVPSSFEVLTTRLQIINFEHMKDLSTAFYELYCDLDTETKELILAFDTISRPGSTIQLSHEQSQNYKTAFANLLDTLNHINELITTYEIHLRDSNYSTVDDRAIIKLIPQIIREFTRIGDLIPIIENFGADIDLDYMTQSGFMAGGTFIAFTGEVSLSSSSTTTSISSSSSSSSSTGHASRATTPDDEVLPSPDNYHFGRSFDDSPITQYAGGFFFTTALRESNSYNSPADTIVEDTAYDPSLPQQGHFGSFVHDFDLETDDERNVTPILPRYPIHRSVAFSDVEEIIPARTSVPTLQLPAHLQAEDEDLALPELQPEATLPALDPMPEPAPLTVNSPLPLAAMMIAPLFTTMISDYSSGSAG